MAKSTKSFAANIAVRAFLIGVTEVKTGKVFDRHRNNGINRNDKTILGKDTWNEIKNEFKKKCAYCGKDQEEAKPEVEHLEMLNRQQCGLDHPGNVVPCCSSCNKRKSVAGERAQYIRWDEQLCRISCGSLEDGHEHVKDYNDRETKIKAYLGKYPRLTCDEKKKVRGLAQRLYEDVTSKTETSLNHYKEVQIDQLS